MSVYLPIVGNTKREVLNAALDGYLYDTRVGEVSTLGEGNILSSKLENGNHAPVLDLDFPCQLIPSSTPGHFHLAMDIEVEPEAYWKLIDALEEAKIIQTGYKAASRHRGFTAIRLPWVKKDDEKRLPDQF